MKWGCSQGRVRINLTYQAAICTVETLIPHEVLHFPHGLRLHPHRLSLRIRNIYVSFRFAICHLLLHGERERAESRAGQTNKQLRIISTQCVQKSELALLPSCFCRARLQVCASLIVITNVRLI